MTIDIISFALGGQLQQSSSPAPAQLTVTVQGKDFLLPLIREPFPPAEEINPKPSRPPTYLVPVDLPWGRAKLRYGDFVFEREIGGDPLDHLYAIGPLVAYAQQKTGNGPVRRNRFSDPARPGDRITLWGTGFARATVFVAETETAADLTKQTDGLDRIEFTLPVDTPSNCSQWVRVNLSLVAIATAAPGIATCSHTLGIVPSDLIRLDRGQTVSISTFEFSAEQINVLFGEFSLVSLPPNPNSQPFFPSEANLPPPVAGCSVTAFPEREGGGSTVFASPPGLGPQRPPPQQIYKAELISPDGTIYAAESYDYGQFRFSSSSNDPIWKPGSWTFRHLSPTVGAVTVVARRPFQWTNQPDFEALSLDRDFVLEWDRTLGDSVEGVMFVRAQFAERPVDGVSGHMLLCRAPMTDGKLVVPSDLMRAIQWLPSRSSASTGAGHFYRPSISRAPDGRYLYVFY